MTNIGKFVRFLAGAVVLIMGCQTMAAPSVRTAVGQSGLMPLDDRDMGRTTESGCQSSFSDGHDTLIFMIGHDFMVRTAAGLAICRISDAQFGSFGDGPTTIACGGRRLSVRRTGRIIAHEEADSAEGPALLMVSRGDGKAVRGLAAIRGNWGTAC